MEDLRLSPTFQRHLQCLETELCVQAVRELPAEDVSREQINDCRQVEKSLLQRDIGDVGRPDLIHTREQPEIHQAGESLRWVSGKRRAWLLVDRP